MKRYLLLAAMAATLVAPAAAHAKRYNLLMTYGQDILLAGKVDDVAIRAQCIQNEGGMGFDVLRVYAVVAQNSVLRGSNSYPGNGSYLTAVTPAASAQVNVVSALTGDENFNGTIDSGFVLNLTTRHGFTYTAETTVLGLNSGANDCVLSINLDAIKKFKTVE